MDSVEAQIIADSVESGLSIARTLGFLNEHLVGEGREAATMSSIISVVQRLRPMIKKVDKQKQGSSDPNSDWARARYLFTKQLMIRLGVLADESPYDSRFARNTAGHLSIDQIAWWDETHRKCLIGGIGGDKKFCLQFKRNKQGLLDPNGEYSKKNW